MSKYIKLDTAIEHTNQLYHGDEVEAWLESLPTIDIVRCKDCIRAKSWKCPLYRAGYTYKADDFCSDGERIEE